MTLRYGFLWDDFPQVVDNPWLRDWRSLVTIFTSDSWAVQGSPGQYRPLMHAVYLGLYQWFGPAAVAFHAANVVLHALNTMLLLLLVSRLHLRLGGAAESCSKAGLAAALVFALHPANANAVAMISGMDNLLCAFFVFGALLAHLRGGPLQNGLITAIALLLAVLSRETALVLPVLLVLSDLVGTPLPASRAIRARLPHYGLCAAALCGYLLLRYGALGGNLIGTAGGVPPWKEMVLDGPVLLVRYLRILAFPFPLAVWPEYVPVRSLADFRFLASLGVLLLLSGAAAWLVRRSRLALFALSLIILPLLVVLYTQRMVLAISNHRLYLPTAGLGMLLAIGLCRPRAATSFLTRNRITTIVAVILAALTAAWTPVYTNGVTYWSEAVRNSPRRWLPHLHLGIALVGAGRESEGIVELRRAMALDPGDPLAHFHLGGVYARRGGQEDLAAAEYRRALALDPTHFPSLANLAQLELNAERYPEALELLDRAVRFAPGHPWVRDRHGMALIVNGQTAAGIAELEAAVELAPWDEKIRGHLEQARRSLGNPDP